VGGTCRVSSRAVKLTADGFALCAPVANGREWRNYQVRLAVRAPANVTAIVELRASTAGRIEIAIGRSGVSIKQQIGRRWFALRHVMALAQAAPDGTLPVKVRVTGTLLQVQIGSITIRQHLKRTVDNGVIAVGLVSLHRRGSIMFSQPAIVTLSQP
jgi:hypothetical protein